MDEMTPQKAYVWYDPEADFLSVTFDDKLGEMRDTEDERVMAKVDDEGNIIGFHILAIRTLKGTNAKPFNVDLSSKRPQRLRSATD